MPPPQSISTLRLPIKNRSEGLAAVRAGVRECVNRATKKALAIRAPGSQQNAAAVSAVPILP